MCLHLNVRSDVEISSELIQNHLTQFILPPVTGFFAHNTMEVPGWQLISVRLHCVAQVEMGAICGSSWLHSDNTSVSTSRPYAPFLAGILLFIFRYPTLIRLQ